MLHKNNDGEAAASGGESSPDSANEIAHDVMAGAVDTLGARVGLKYPAEKRKADTARETDEDKDDEREEDEFVESEKKPDPKGKKRDEDDESDQDEEEDDEGEESDDSEAKAKTDDESEADESEEKEKAEGEESDDGTSDDDEDDADKLAQEHEQLVNTKLKDLPKEVRGRVQSILNQRIGKIVAKATAEKSDLEARVSELAGELDETKARGGAPIIVPGVNPLFLAQSEGDIERRLEQLETFEEWAEQNRDGYEGDGTDKDPAYTAEQIRARLRELRREKERIIPAARANLAQRGKIDTFVRKVYPKLFDPKSAEYRDRQQILKAQPELRRFADSNVLILQQILGARALKELLDAQKDGAGKAASGKNKDSDKELPRRKAPRAPSAGGAAKGSVLSSKKGTPASTEAVKKFTESRSRASMLDAIGSLVPGL